MSTRDEIEKQIRYGEEEAAKIGVPPPTTPDHHPYFWAGWLAALRLVRDLLADAEERE